jgi:hypothetical protein
MLAALAIVPLRCLFGPTEGLVRGWPAVAISALALTGVAAAAVWLLLAAWGTRRILRSSRPCTQRTRAILAELTAGRGRVRAVVDDRAGRPFVVGFFRPVIVLPAALETQADATINLVLTHEYVHIHNQDYRWSWLSTAVQGLWFYLPMTWWLRAQMRLDEELLADRVAAQRFPAPGDYAATLLSLVPGTVAAPATPKGAAADLPPVLTLRMRMLLGAPPQVELRPPLPWSLAACVAAAALVMLLARFSSAVLWPPDHHARQAAAALRADWPTVTIAPQEKGSVLPVHVSLLDDLPESFVLTFQADAPAHVLAQVRLMGLPLRADPPRAPQEDRSSSVTLVRGRDGIRLWVNGREASTREASSLRTLTLESTAHEAVHLRNVSLREVP